MRGFSANAVTEHLLKGQPITRLEAINLYGLQDLTRTISRLRAAGFRVERTKTTLEQAVLRLQKVIKMSPPKNVPIREMMISEYRVIKR